MNSTPLIVIYFFYGLAFFSMGLLVAMEGGRSTDARLRMALRPLAGFGLVHAVHEWLEQEQAPTRGCPTHDLIEGGRCQRSPNDGKCLLLLPFNHPDWQRALNEEFDRSRQVFRWRAEPLAAPVGRTPLTIEEVTGWGD